MWAGMALGYCRLSSAMLGSLQAPDHRVENSSPSKNTDDIYVGRECVYPQRVKHHTTSDLFSDPRKTHQEFECVLLVHFPEPVERQTPLPFQDGAEEFAYGLES